MIVDVSPRPPTPIAVFPAAGACQVCGHEAFAVAVHKDSRDVHHRQRAIPPCHLPNPVQKGQTT
ncbi:hypothetical protein [Actinokineospora globicatena]|uniref:Uncharacterized protein n=1 Tax=Actinokineospora globicatena TaxID=103729 RepID=A0A9W6V9C0_9PSEU|nr:hypothetical protein [Actinokineospora globicatena]GLW91819.1 hypothetical protein Aglo03_26350 [Actinokineospora globicatena]